MTKKESKKGSEKMKKVLSILGSFLVVVAAASVAPASMFIWIHHPRVPKCLQK